MSKDTIYIDVEDDITAIIGKVKASQSKIVALVPPKRIGVLQSAVNLRLLARAAKQTNKHLVLISGNTALTALAASAGIPSARTLQSKPELAAIPDMEDDGGDDIIDGATLPVGDLAGIDDPEGGASQATASVDTAVRATIAEEVAKDPLFRPQPKSRKNGIKVPNFDTFRKKMALIIGGLILLAGFFVWAIWFAPHAVITITARKIESSANPKVILATDAKTDVGAGTLKAVRQEIKKEASLTFEATGEKEVGEKASGQVTFRNCYEDPVTIKAGTGVSAGGNTYITKAAVTVDAGKGNFGGCTSPGVSSPITVEAQAIGEDYNMEQGSFCVAEYECSGPRWVKASVTEAIDGGSKKKVKVVTKEDVEKAAEQVASQEASAVKQQLIEKFGDGVITIDATFATNKDGVASAPAVDTEATDGKAKLVGAVSYTMLGVAESEAGHYLDGYFTEKIKDSENQRVYNNGVAKTTFVDVKAVDNGFTATMTATAELGPKIDAAAVKREARGKKFGAVQSAIEDIPGVENVDITFSPFWVKTVPSDENRITIEFSLDESQ